MVGMSVCEEDGVGRKRKYAFDPIRPAIEHHLTALGLHHERAVASMQAAADVDIPARPEKDQLHGGL
jgi:hypothetical protein